ncbi:unnamed protein product [Tilletia controversa]|nr:unnamed protein product [Tilletia controversa]
MAENGLTAEQLAIAMAAAAAMREAERRGKEDEGDKVSIPKLKLNLERGDSAVRPWPGAPYSIPRDVVELFKRGNQPPLIWLTNVDDVAEDEQDPATLVDELSLAVAARASDEHWGLWRQYVRNVLAKIWEPRRDSELNFNVGKIDVNILRLTEEAASVPQGRADDHSNDGKNFVTFLLTASREEAEAAANHPIGRRAIGTPLDEA